MTTTVTLNPCIDLTVDIETLQRGALQMARHQWIHMGGKGINVSVVLRALGLPTMCTGLVFDSNGKQLTDFLEQRQIAHAFAQAKGTIRTNIKIMEQGSHTLTEINHPGHPIDAAAEQDFLCCLWRCAQNSRIVVLSGRIASGAGEDIYKRALQMVHTLGVKTVVDTAGEAMRQALEAHPFLIKPNLHELETMLGCKIHTRQEIVQACRRLIAGYVQMVCVSMGKDGTMLVDDAHVWFAPALSIPVRGLQGAGDSMVAGLCKGIREGVCADRMLAYGVAAASASILREGTALCRQEDFLRLLPQVVVQRL